MIHNYIRNVSNYYKGDKNLSFFSYIAGGFCKTIKQRAGADLGHDKLQSIFSLNREITGQDIIRL